MALSHEAARVPGNGRKVSLRIRIVPLRGCSFRGSSASTDGEPVMAEPDSSCEAGDSDGMWLLVNLGMVNHSPTRPCDVAKLALSHNMS